MEKKPAKTESLLVEILTEELPPRGLKNLGEAFASGIANGLRSRNLLTSESEVFSFATPRRLAVRISNVLSKANDTPVEERLMPLSVARGTDGKASHALRKKLAGMGRTLLADGFPKVKDGPDSLYVKSDGKTESVYLSTLKPGWTLAEGLQRTQQDTIDRLPTQKVMRWGEGKAEFVRPVHGLVMMHGAKIVAGEVFGAKSSNQTLGHRFLCTRPIVLKRANDYERTLRTNGKVEPDLAIRRKRIAEELTKGAGKEVGLVLSDALLDEITALVEWPVVYEGRFNQEFLQVPEECLILSMQQHQKYVPLRDTTNGKLLPRFLFVSNLEAKDPREIIHGNERVLNARLSDAKFFYEQDRKEPLKARVPKLEQVVYHSKLGNQLDRVKRIKVLAQEIAQNIGAEVELAEQAAWLSKADLLTGMVGEFPELQGIMGRYYALHDGEPTTVSDAIGDQYKLRLDNADPENLVSVSLYLADRIEQTVGLFGVGERPTGEKDPFALRRAALGIIKVFGSLSAAGQLTGRTAIDLKELLERAAGLFAAQRLAADTANAVYEFIIERYRNYLVPFFSKDSIESVLSQRPPIGEVEPRIQAVEAFRKLPEAESLAAANKRIRNILRKSESASASFDISLLFETPEKVLHESLQEVSPRVTSSMETRDYARAMQVMAGLKGPVDSFFDKVLVNTEDIRLRNNRHALLRELDKLMNRVADISKLAT